MNVDTRQPESPPLPPEVVAVLNQVRSRIRRFLLIHGSLVTLLWLALCYGVAVGLDRIPVWLGWPELSVPVRLGLLVIVVFGAGWLLLRTVVLPLLVPLRPASLALLLERRFPELKDSLATLVGGAGGASPVDPAVRQRLAARTVECLQGVSVSRLFNRGLLVRSAAACGLVFTGIVLLATGDPETFRTSLKRLVLLDSDPWPRACRLEMAGLRVLNSQAGESIPELQALREFRDQTISVASGCSVSVLVRAELGHPENPRRRLPGECRLQFTTQQGERGSLPMNPVAGPRDGYQWYAVDGRILNGLQGPLQFHVRGDDHRIGPFQIQTVPSPALVDMHLDLVYPDYMVDTDSARWTPRSVRLSAGTRIPRGTRVRLQATANRPLQDVFVQDPTRQAARQLEVAGAVDVRQFELDLGRPGETVRLDLYLRDTEGVVSRQPARVLIGMVEDQPPEVKFRLQGIGTAVTPTARIPVNGMVRDDYDVRSTWAALTTPLTADPLAVPVDTSQSGELNGVLDLLDLQRTGVLPRELPTDAGNRITLTVKADDYCNLTGRTTNTGVGQQYSLELVKPAELLRILERLEADQRRRLEQIVEELGEARDNISRSLSAGSVVPDPVSQDGTEGDPITTETVAVGPLRQLYIQRALLQIRKSTREIDAVARAFDDIRGQLVNNRIDAEDRKTRIARKVVAPLQQLARRTLVDLESGLLQAEQQLPGTADRNRSGDGLADEDALTRDALARTDAVIRQLEEILGSLLKFETRNELLEIVRRLLEQEQTLLKRTKAHRERDAFHDIFDQ